MTTETVSIRKTVTAIREKSLVIFLELKCIRTFITGAEMEPTDKLVNYMNSEELQN